MNTYIIFDIETSGLNSKYAEIIELSAIKIVNDSIIDEFSSLVRPSMPLDPESQKINGITEEMLSDAPSLSCVLTDFLEFIGSDTLSGYNVSSFDLPILRRVILDCLSVELNNPYFDILQDARSRLAFLPDRKLVTVASYLGVSPDGAHRALADCHLTYQCYKKMMAFPPCENPSPSGVKKRKPSYTDKTKSLQILQGFLLGIVADDKLLESEVMSLKNWLDNHNHLSGEYPFDRVFSVIKNALHDGVLDQCELDEMFYLFKQFSNPTCSETSPSSASCVCAGISQKNICLTGEFMIGDRKAVKQLITERGGICKSTVTGKTDYVLVGSLGSPDWSCGNYGNKIKQALELNEKGKNIQIVKEEDFFNISKDGE